MKKIKSIYFLSAIFIFSNCDFENDKKAIEPVFVENKIEFPNSVYSWYRGEINSYSMGKSITVKKQLIYIFIDKNKTWSIFHSMIGYSFIGSGSYQFKTESSNQKGTIIGEALNESGETSHYEISYLSEWGNYNFTLLGFGGAPNTKLTIVKEEVNIESFVNDVAKTILQQ